MTNRFVFVAPAYNAARTMRQFMLSLAAQSYQNWGLVLVDDMSTDDTANACRNIARELGLWKSGNIHVIPNDAKKWEVANVLTGIREGIVGTGKLLADDIVCRIDPDDYLCDNDALRIMDEVYRTTDADALWTMHRWFDDKRITKYNISQALPEGADPYRHPWVSSHLKTFRKRLIDDVNEENFRGPDGEYIKRAGDQAIYLPVLHRATKRVFLPVVTYAYRCNMDPETFQTPDAKFQAAEAEFLRNRGFVS